MLEKQSNPTITEDEAALYDRQIRLWGLDAQRRLRGARVLLIGLGGLGAEVAKNIVLSGIKSLKLLDHTNVCKDDFCSQFFVERGDLGKNRAESSLSRVQLLNPMVEVSVDTENVANKNDPFFQDFDVVCATCCSRQELIRINNICHEANISFYAGDVFGYYGYMFADLIHHEYAQEVPAVLQKKADTVKGSGDGEPTAKKPKVDNETVTVKKEADFVRLQEALDLDWSEEGKVKALKRTPHTYFITQVLFEFREKKGRYVTLDTLAEDKETLQQLRVEVLNRLKVTKKDVIPEDFANFCFAELSPVAAVVGGVLGQEIIKAVSQKDAPHNNFFFFNGVEGSGMVDCFKQ